MILNTLRATHRRTRHSRGISKPQRALQNRASAVFCCFFFFFGKYPCFSPEHSAPLVHQWRATTMTTDDGRRGAPSELFWWSPRAADGKSHENGAKTRLHLRGTQRKYDAARRKNRRMGSTACTLIRNKVNKQSETHTDKINPDVNSSSFCRTSMKEKKSHNILF